MPQSLFDGEPGQADSVEPTVCITSSPALSPHQLPGISGHFKTQAQFVIKMFECLMCTVPACAGIEAWHPEVSGTGSSNSSAGWTQTSAQVQPKTSSHQINPSFTITTVTMSKILILCIFAV